MDISNIKYHPILFSTPMVKAIIGGQKNVTRRTKGLEKINLNLNDWVLDGIKIVDRFVFHSKINGDEIHLKAPYNEGDILWVRETFFQNGDEYIYFADGTCCQQFEQCECSEIGKPKWKPSIFMPKKASRNFLEILDVRIERLKDISVWSAESEGVEVRFVDGFEEYKDYLAKGITSDEPWGETYYPANPILSFMSLWKYINGMDSWDFNPFVWVIRFAVIDKPLDFNV
jgi:hypothetical protein